MWVKARAIQNGQRVPLNFKDAFKNFSAPAVLYITILPLNTSSKKSFPHSPELPHPIFHLMTNVDFKYYSKQS